MKRISTLLLATASLFIAQKSMADNVTVDNAQDLITQFTTPRTATQTDTIFVKYTGQALNMKKIAAADMPKAGAIYIIGLPDEVTGERPEIWGEFELPVNKADDHLSLFFENIVLKNRNETGADGPNVANKYLFSAKGKDAHYMDSLVFRKCDISRYGRGFYRVQMEKDGSFFADGGRLANLLVENCRVSYPYTAEGSVQFAMFLVGQRMNSAVFRNNTFYDMVEMNRLLAFDYMDDNTKREPMKFLFENNTVCAYTSAATLFDFTKYSVEGSSLTMKNNIFFVPSWTDNENPVSYVPDEDIVPETLPTIAAIDNADVVITNNFLYGYKPATGTWASGKEENDLSLAKLDMDLVDFSGEWETDMFDMATSITFYTAGTDGSPIGDMNNYATDLIEIIAVNVHIEGSTTAKVIIAPAKEAYVVGDVIKLIPDTKGQLNKFLGWSDGVKDSIRVIKLEKPLDITAKFEELPFISAWTLEQIQANKVMLQAPLKPNYGDENIVLKYAKWDGEQYADAEGDVIETRNNKFPDDERNCFMIHTAESMFGAAADEHADYAYIDIPSATAGSYLQASVGTDNATYTLYAISYSLDNHQWTDLATFEMDFKNQWKTYQAALPKNVEGKPVQIRIKGVERYGNTKTSESSANELMFVSELYLVRGDESGIESLTFGEQPMQGKTFNLMGVQVGDGARGLLIRNGKKYFVR